MTSPYDSPTFRATDGALWRWNPFRSDFNRLPAENDANSPTEGRAGNLAGDEPPSSSPPQATNSEVERLRTALDRAQGALRRLQEGAGLALNQLTEDGPVADFLAAIHRECVKGLIASDDVTNEAAALDQGVGDSSPSGGSDA